MSFLLKVIIVLARGASVWFALTSFLGFVWFASHDTKTSVYFVVTIVSLLLFAFFPRRSYPAAWWAITTLAIVALIVSIPQMYADLTLVNGADYGALTLRLIICLLFVIMVVEAVLKRYRNADAV